MNAGGTQLRIAGRSLDWTNHLHAFSCFFAVFLFAGVLKVTPRFSWIPFDLTLLALLASLVIGLLIFRRHGICKSPELARGAALMSALVVWAVLSLFWSPGREYAQAKVLLFGTLGCWSFFGGALVGAEPSRFRWFTTTIVVLALWMSIEVLVMFGGGVVIASEEWGRSYIGFGRLIGYGCLVLVSRVVESGYGGARGLLRLALLVVLVAGMFMGGARGPLVGMIAGLAVFVLSGIRFENEFLRLKMRVLGLAVGLAVVPVAAVALSRSGVFLRTVQRLIVLISQSDTHSFGRRLWYWSEAWRLWLEKPLFGHGVGSWSTLLGWGDVRAYPHDILLELGVELGLVGVGLFLALCFNATSRIRLRHSRAGHGMVLVCALLAASIVNSLISGDLTDNRAMFAILGMATALQRKA